MVSTLLKNISQLGLLPQYMEKKKCSKPPTSKLYQMIYTAMNGLKIAYTSNGNHLLTVMHIRVGHKLSCGDPSGFLSGNLLCRVSSMPLIRNWWLASSQMFFWDSGKHDSRDMINYAQRSQHIPSSPSPMFKAPSLPELKHNEKWFTLAPSKKLVRTSGCLCCIGWSTWDP